MEALRAVGLRYQVGETKILTGLDLAIAPGEIAALVGPSGSGKSTALYCLSGLLSPSSGEVWVYGERVDGWSEAARAQLRLKSFGFVFQFGELLPELDLLGNVALPLRLLGRSRRDAERHATALLERLGLGPLTTRHVYEVSGGEAQRAALARAVATEPRVIFADEPTGALDQANSAVVMDLLVGLARDKGCALLIVTHEQSVASIVDSVVSLTDGRIANHARADRFVGA